VSRPSPLQEAADSTREGCGMSASCSPLPPSPCIVTVRSTTRAYCGTANEKARQPSRYTARRSSVGPAAPLCKAWRLLIKVIVQTTHGFAPLGVTRLHS
jgi:hypothetical protein